MNLELLRQKEGQNEKYFGFCIYCGSTEKLSDEHALPYSLNGEQILKKASCDKCASITSRFEGKILRGLLDEYRFYRRFRTRSGYSKFNIIKRFLTRNSFGEEVEKAIHLNRRGLFLFLPEFTDPRYFSPKEGIGGVGIRGFHLFKAHAKKQNIEEGVKEILIKTNFPTEDFLRFLCKIAICFTYLKFDHKDINSYVTQFILGKGSLAEWKFVGSPIGHMFQPNSKAGVMLFEKENVLFCDLKLFSDIPVVYRVVVGELT